MRSNERTWPLTIVAGLLALGVFVATVGLVEAIFLAVAQLPASSAPGLMMDLAISCVSGGFILWVLLRRWP